MLDKKLMSLPMGPPTDTIRVRPAVRELLGELTVVEVRIDELRSELYGECDPQADECGGVLSTEPAMDAQLAEALRMVRTINHKLERMQERML